MLFFLKMYRITESMYESVARELRQALEAAEVVRSSKYSGSVEVVENGIAVTFTATLIVYREKRLYPEGVFEEISDIVPVWWECTTEDDEGLLIMNDFRFDEFKKYLDLGHL